ncbi:MAG: hypothetical protein ACRYFX_00970 [Janthinobacterium lividum]
MLEIASITSQSAQHPNGYPLTRYDVHARLLLSQDRLAGLALALLAGLSILVALISQGTYDTGDSLGHYLYARYAPQHPLHLLHAWAKPLFTLLAVGPAQFGFTGIKLFQCGLVAASAWLAYRTARHLGLAWPALAVVFCYAAPDYFRIQFSGLTEPLFGLLLIAAVHSAVAGHPMRSAMLLSWLPLVRSEGILLWGLWGLYLLWNGEWRALPWLGLGYLVYSIVGGLVLHNFAWLFTDNPYALHSPYGSGHWRHFLDHIPTLLGWPLALLGLVGGLYTLRRALQTANWREHRFRAELLLINGSLVLFTLTHSVLWAYGLFGSFGMTRVLCVLVPLCAVVALTGLNWLAQLPARPAHARQVRLAGAGLVVAMLLLPEVGYHLRNNGFVGHDSNLRWYRDFRKASDLVLADQAADWLQHYDPQWGWHPLGWELYYFSEHLGVDPFDPIRRARLNKDYAAYLDGVPAGTYIYWDDWFAPVEGRINLDMLQQDARFKQLWFGSLDQDPKYPSGWVRRAYIFIKVK